MTTDQGVTVRPGIRIPPLRTGRAVLGAPPPAAGFETADLASARNIDDSGGSGPMAPIRLLTREAALEAMARRVPAWPTANLLAMYSSALGGVLTDRALMNVPIDDHLVHRGHGVFDTCNVINGRAYGLDFHLDRLYTSARQARIDPPPRSQLKDAILATIATAGERNGVYCRYWLSVGRGDFSVSPRQLPTHGAIAGEAEPPTPSTFYAAVHRLPGKPLGDDAVGVAEATVKIPLKTQMLATMKSNNYLLNALVAMEAEDRGGTLGIQVDPDGCLVESSIACVAIVTRDGVLRAPPFDYTLASTTVVRSFELARANLLGSSDGLLRDVRQEPTLLTEAYDALELIALGGLRARTPCTRACGPQAVCIARILRAAIEWPSARCAHTCPPVAGGAIRSVVSLDGRTIGDGKVGPVVRALSKLLEADMANPEFLDDIPYETYAQ